MPELFRSTLHFPCLYLPSISNYVHSKASMRAHFTIHLDWSPKVQNQSKPPNKFWLVCAGVPIILEKLGTPSTNTKLFKSGTGSLPYILYTYYYIYYAPPPAGYKAYGQPPWSPFQGNGSGRQWPFPAELPKLVPGRLMFFTHSRFYAICSC